jgi:tRNA modification GTPase
MNTDTIVALATGQGGAIAVIRVSGDNAITLTDSVFAARNGRPLSDAAGYTVHFGEVRGEDEVIDEVLVTVFRAPHSYTGENAVEISCHASPYITGRIIALLIAAGGPQVRLAEPGEFTVRAFLAGKMDLTQAEAVADLIASQGHAQHSLAMNQLRGGVSSALAGLRGELTELAALLELELDFGEEDVEFASRGRLATLATLVAGELDSLIGSFALGNAIRQGVPVAIVGKPNAGKSTLLNALVGDDRAMTSEIAGTTRDRIEERVNIGGIDFRLIDTAGLRNTDDVLEKMGIDRAREAVRTAYAVLLVVDAAGLDEADVAAQISDLDLHADQRLCVVVNKIDRADAAVQGIFTDLQGKSPRGAGGGLNGASNVIPISAKTGTGLDALRGWLMGSVDVSALESGSAVVSGARHHEALSRARGSVGRVLEGLEVGLSADLLAEEIRETLHHLGTITGSITTDDILGTIFSKFCIGK